MGQVRWFLTISTPWTPATTFLACSAAFFESTLPPSDTVPWSDSTWMVYFLVIESLSSAVLTLVVKVASPTWSLVALYACLAESPTEPSFIEDPLWCSSRPAVLSCAYNGGEILNAPPMRPECQCRHLFYSVLHFHLLAAATLLCPCGDDRS